MKKTKKTIAIVLCLCLVFGAAVIPVSAYEKKSCRIDIDSAIAVSFKDGDPETVTRIELEIKAFDNDVTFDTVDTTCEIGIGLYDNIFDELYSNLGEFLSVNKKEALADARIAVAKPVSFRNGKLTLDIYSNSGEAGAKLVDFQYDVKSGDSDWEIDTVTHFPFLLAFPEGLLKDSSSGAVSEESYKVQSIEGLEAANLKLPFLVKAMFGFYSGDFGRAALAMFVALPLCTFTIPVWVSIIIVRALRLLKIYDTDFHVMRQLKVALEYVRLALTIH